MADERKYGLTVTPFMKDTDKIGVLAKQEIGFIKFIIKPLYELANAYCLDGLSHLIDNMDKATVEWGVILAEEEKKNAEKQS
jgi:hypothetical protein